MTYRVTGPVKMTRYDWTEEEEEETNVFGNSNKDKKRRSILDGKQTEAKKSFWSNVHNYD